MRRSMWWFNKAARKEVVDGVCVPCWKHVRGKWQFNKQKGNEMPRGRHATALLTPWCQATHSSCQPESLRVPRQDETVQPQCCYSARAEPWAEHRRLGFPLHPPVWHIARCQIKIEETCWTPSKSVGRHIQQKKLNSVCSCLYTSFHRVLESSRDNNYPRHYGFRGGAAADNNTPCFSTSPGDWYRQLKNISLNSKEWWRTPTLPKNRQNIGLQAAMSPTENSVPLDIFVQSLQIYSNRHVCYGCQTTSNSSWLLQMTTPWSNHMGQWQRKHTFAWTIFFDILWCQLHISSARLRKAGCGWLAQQEREERATCTLFQVTTFSTYLCGFA